MAFRLRRALSLSYPLLHRSIHQPRPISAHLSSPISTTSPAAAVIPSPTQLARPFTSTSTLFFKTFDSVEHEEIGPDTILFEGCDYNHWLITVDFPKDSEITREQMIETYIDIAAQVFGSVEEAKQKIYALSTTTYQGFQVECSEQTSEMFKSLPGVVFVLPDSYIDPVNKEYGGDKYVNGEIFPRPPPVQYGRRDNRERRRRDYGPPHQQNYGPPHQQNYGPPQQQNYGPPQQQNYGPPQPQNNDPRPRQDFRAPPPRQDFASPPPPQQNFGSPSQQNFGPPAQQNYGPPAQQNYGPPAQPNYGSPAQPNYGSPAQPNYGSPAQQNYGPPAQQNYGPPPRQNYGLPPQQNYGNHPNSSPQQNYVPQGSGDRRGFPSPNNSEGQRDFNPGSSQGPNSAYGSTRGVVSEQAPEAWRNFSSIGNNN